MFLNPRCPRKSTCVFGCTAFNKVNPDIHLYVRGKENYLRRGVSLLHDFVNAAAAAPNPIRVVIESFDGGDYGEGYLDLHFGDRLHLLRFPEGVDPEGWCYGMRLNDTVSGWFPPTFVRVPA